MTEALEVTFFSNLNRNRTAMATCYTYILRCEGNLFYTGSTKNIGNRFAQHMAGEGANFTKRHKPIEIVYLEKFDRIDLAYNREKQIQGWGRAKKLALIESHFKSLSELSMAYRDKKKKY